MREGAPMNAKIVDMTGDAQPVLLSEHPLVTECPPAALGAWLTPNPLHYVRHHFDTMHLEADTWRLSVEGLVERPQSFSLDTLTALPSRTVAVTLECAGNGRSRFCPSVEGNPFAQGAVSTAEWTGVPLATILDAIGVRPEASQVW